MSEQVEIFQKEKRKTSDELESATNQLLEAQGKLSDLERKCKNIETDRQQMQNELDDTRDALQLEINKNISFQTQVEKIKTDAEKKLLHKDDELDAQKVAAKRQIETLQTQIEDHELKHKSDLISIKKKHQIELEEALYKTEQTLKAKVEAENLLKKAQLANKVFEFKKKCTTLIIDS